MGKIFDMDSPIMRFLNRMGDLLILNLIVIVCCIPIVTVGATLTAMHYILIKMVRDEEGYLVRGFFKSFVRNFKQATLLWFIILAVIMVYVGDVLIFNYSGIVFPQAVVIAVVVVAVFALMVMTYIFPLLARFDNSVKNTLKNAAIFAFANLPKTLLMLAIYILPIVIIYFSSYTIIFAIMFGISLPAYAAAHIYGGIFKKFEPETEEISDFDFCVNVEEENEEKDGNAE